MKSRWQLKYGQTSSTYDPTTSKESTLEGFGTSRDRIVPYIGYKRGSIESIENNRIISDSEFSSQDNDIKKMKEFKRKRCICFAVITVVICLVLAACITSALLIHVLYTPKNKNSYVESKISATAINKQYLKGMEDTSSKVFKDFEIELCSAAQTKLDQTSNCKVESLRNGSIVVVFFIYIKTEQSEVEIKGLIMDKLFVKEEGKVFLGFFEIKSDSFFVTETRTISEESVPTDSIYRPVDKDTASSSSSGVSTTEGSTSFTLQSANPTTSFASPSDSSSNEIESSTRVILEESTIAAEIQTTTTEESTSSLILESDSLPSSTYSIASSDTTSSIANSINVETNTAPIASTTETYSTTQMASSNTEPIETSYILSSTQDSPSNEYGYMSSLKLSTDRSSEVGSSSFEITSTTNVASLTSTLNMEYVSKSLLESSTQVPLVHTSTEPFIKESTQLLTTDVLDELQKSSISIHPTTSIVEDMYSSDAVISHVSDSLNSNIQPHTATTSNHQTSIVEVESSRVMNSYSTDPSSAMEDIVSSHQQMDDESTHVMSEQSTTSEISDLHYAPSSVTNSYVTSLYESPVAATPSFSVGHVTSTDQQMYDKSTVGTSDLMITAEPSTASEISDLQYTSSPVTHAYIPSTDEGPVADTLSFSVGHATSTDGQMHDISTAGTSDLVMTAQPSTTSEFSDPQYTSSPATHAYIPSTDEGPVAATPSFSVGHVTSTDGRIHDISTTGMSDLMITAQSSTSKISDLQYAPSSVTNSYVASSEATTSSFVVGYVTSTGQQLTDKSTSGTSDQMITAQPCTASEISDLQYTPSIDRSSVAEMSFSATPSIPDEHVTSAVLSDISFVSVTDSFGGNLLQSSDSPLETPSLVIDGSVTENPSIFFTSEMEVSSINPSSSITELSTSLPIPKPDVKATGETVYQDQGNVTFICNVDNYHNFTSIILEYDDVVIFNTTEADIEDPEWSLVQTTLEDTLTLTATYNNSTCEDSNKSFRCSVYGDWGVVVDSASSVVKVKPQTPELKLPYKFIENQDTLEDIDCSVDAGVPAATVSWSVEFIDGQKEDPYDFTVVTTTDSAQSCSNMVKSSIRRTFGLNWHNASLCCTATQDEITKSTCKKLYIVPANYCMGKETKLYDHPYDDCFLFIQCASNVTYINRCGEANGLCFNENTGSCSDAVSTTMDPNFVDDPYSCVGKPNPSYIPIDGSCNNKYGWCVNNVKYIQACPGEAYFNGSGPPEYTLQCAPGKC